ncbi:MAG: hypothetical protein COB29_13270 [Sulfitobacter sp.]|nr:MAG: hypothetical protein COB29_13270 [Sulfitobacter sp.]
MPRARANIDTTGFLIPKRHPVRSDKYKASFKGRPCFVCGAQDGTIVPAHVNYHNFARGFKASDARIAALCKKCHDEHDGCGDIAWWWMVNYVLPLLESNYEEWKNG